MKGVKQKDALRLEGTGDFTWPVILSLWLSVDLSSWGRGVEWEQQR